MRIPDIVEHHCGCNEGRFVIFEAQAFDACGVEMACYEALCPLGAHYCIPYGEVEPARDDAGIPGNDLARGYAVHLAVEIPGRIHFRHAKISGGDIDEGDAVTFFLRIPAYCHEVVRLVAHEVVVLDDEPGRDDLHHLPVHETLYVAGHLSLLADSHFNPLPDEAGYVGACAVIRDPAHGNGVFLSLVPGSQRKA